jgi:hypothetical protein
LGYNRQVTDFGMGLSRAERENSQYGLDLNAQRYFQAAQSGWEPPAWYKKKMGYDGPDPRRKIAVYQRSVDAQRAVLEADEAGTLTVELLDEAIDAPRSDRGHARDPR